MANKKNISVKFCPKCKSTNVKYIFELTNLFGVMPKQRCGSCGLEGITFPVIVTSEKKLKTKKSTKGKKR